MKLPTPRACSCTALYLSLCLLVAACAGAPPQPERTTSTPIIAVTPSVDLSTISTRSLSSTSPDRKWRAEALLGSFPGETWYDYARVTISPTDRSESWIAYERLNEYGGLGTGYISDFFWSADGKYLYFRHTATSDGCGYSFTTNLHQVDLAKRNVGEIPLTGMLFGEITLSPAADRMAYRVPEGILLYALPSGSAHIIPYRWPEGTGYLVGWTGWSPDGTQLAFAVTTPLCDSPEPPQTELMAIDLESGATRQPNRDETWVYLPAQVAADPIPTAALVLHEFLNSLYWGARGGLGDYTYERAAALYGGSYETLVEVNPDLDPEDHVELLRAACEFNGYQCLRLRDVIISLPWWESGGAQVVYFTVYLEDVDGGIFTRGPCCGVEEGLPETQFSFAVRESEDGTFKVLELPPYLP